MKPRPYQQAAIDSFWRDAAKDPKTNQLLALPTGAGKSVIIASIANTAVSKGIRVLCLARSKELLGQNYERYCQVSGTPESAGIYSAGLGLRQTDEPIIFGSVQSLANGPDTTGPRQLLIVDESHQIPKNEDSQYQKILAYHRRDSGYCKMLGLTASPYRLDGGVIFGGRDTQFDVLSYNVPLSELFDGGYLTRPVTLPVKPVDMKGVKVSGGDYNKSEMQTRFLGRSITAEVKSAADEVGLKSVLVFCSGVAHAELVKAELEALGERAAVVTGETLPIMRETFLRQFEDGKIRWLVNVDVLTTGYDCPRVDGIVLARATQSPGLFYQMVGRGFRLFDGKEDCHVMDYGGNIELHGPVDSSTFGIDTIKAPATGEHEPPKRVCPKCFEVQHAALRTCISCGLEFPVRQKDPAFATKESITIKPTQHRVAETFYKLNKGKDGKSDTLMVRYRLHVDDNEKLTATKRWASEWICIEHDGWARGKAAQWWSRRSKFPCPDTIIEALAVIDNGGVAEVTEVTLKKDGKWDRITDYRFGALPDTFAINYDLDDAPF
jgi:DNA repair protein RadD